MRLFAKIFLCAVLVIAAALLFSGYLMITSSYENAVFREAERAVNQFQFDKFSVQSNLLSHADSYYNILLSGFSRELSGITVFFDEDKRLVYSDIEQVGFTLPDSIPDNTHHMRIQASQGKQYITVSGRVSQSGISLYLMIATDISGIIAQKDDMTRNFARVYVITLAIGMGIVFALSVFLTRPIKKMGNAASEIAGGRYDMRLPVNRGDEIGELSQSFNLMAQAVEEKIGELLENARQKEEFVASFAHELKTPLTSVIGYADMLYQKRLTDAQVKDAAFYILNEGLRLEALSLKLMDLIILNRDDFVLQEMRADELFADIEGGLVPLFTEHDAELILDIEPVYIMTEYDLFKTLILNLIDNAIKAGSSKVIITGKQAGGMYTISVADNGRGIPEHALSRITEAFYTVDKSRSRRQHGAGLGLALAQRIAAIHGRGLEFNSTEGRGTTVKAVLRARGDVCD